MVKVGGDDLGFSVRIDCRHLERAAGPGHSPFPM